jgi:YD repeat-containing protein
MEVRDPSDRVLRFERDAAGTLLRIQTISESISFKYDDQKRIASAADAAGRWVTYLYDGGGRLIKVASSDSIVRSYTYSSRDELLTIDEPGWFIENTYDDEGRVVKQITRITETALDGRRPGLYEIDFAYRAMPGAIIETTVTEDDRTQTLYRFDSHRYSLSEVYDTAGFNPIMVSFERQPSTHAVTVVAVTCKVNNQPVSRRAPVGPAGEEQTKYDLVRATCAARPVGNQSVKYEEY